MRVQDKSVLICGLLAMAGCAGFPGTGGPSMGDVPDTIVALAAPGQNLATARLLESDDCYWYEHQGPVETTLLPLRTREGNPICIERVTSA